MGRISDKRILSTVRLERMKTHTHTHCLGVQKVMKKQYLLPLIDRHKFVMTFTVPFFVSVELVIFPIIS